MDDIEEFYKTNKVDKDFNEFLYQKDYPETKNFYQPYCKENNIDEKHRLFFHYMQYGNKNLNYKINNEIKIFNNIYEKKETF